MTGSHAAPGQPVRLISMLMVLATTSQLALSLITPALPSIGRDLGAATAASSTISGFLAGYGAGQLIYGPLSDRFGRLPVLFVGMALFILFSLACAAAPTLGLLLTGRVLQGLGAGACFVMSRAIARDQLDGAALTRALSLIAIAGGLVPAIGPPVGALLLATTGWRGCFVTMALFGVVLLISARLWLHETNHSRLAGLQPGTIFEAFRVVGLDPRFLAPTVSGGCAFAGLYGFYALTPSVLIGAAHVSPTTYSYLIASIAFAYLGGVEATRRLAATIGDRAILRTALAIMGLGAAAALALALCLAPSAATVMGPGLTYIFGVGMQAPVVSVMALRDQAARAGIAAALLGCVQILLSAAGAALAAATGLAAGIDAAAALLAMAALSTLALWIGRRPAAALAPA